MTLYFVRVKDREYQVDVAGEEVRVNGKPVSVRLMPINQNGHFVLKTDTEQREVHIRASGQNSFMATMASRYFNIQVEQKQRRNGKAVPTHHGELKSPMPAIVIAVRVQPGESVTAGQPLVLLESMKMQMEIKSPSDGIVETVLVRAADQVEKGTRLVTIKADVKQ